MSPRSGLSQRPPPVIWLQGLQEEQAPTSRSFLPSTRHCHLRFSHLGNELLWFSILFQAFRESKTPLSPLWTGFLGLLLWVAGNAQGFVRYIQNIQSLNTERQENPQTKTSRYALAAPPAPQGAGRQRRCFLPIRPPPQLGEYAVLKYRRIGMPGCPRPLSVWLWLR